MGGSIKIGNVFGIPVRLHWTFLLLVYAYVLLSGGSAGMALALLAALFGTVFLHELGHSLVARRYGIHVLDITLWPLGGMARMSEMPESPRIEARVAIAGPAVNFVLAALSIVAIPVAALMGLGGLSGALQGFVWINLIMGTFNLVPAFPMDGGRILRCWFARNTDWVSATEKAVTVGRYMAAMMFLASIALMLTGNSPFCGLPLVALFVWFAGARELLSTRLRHGRGLFDAHTGPARGPFRQPSWGTERDASGTGMGDDDESRRDARRPRGPGVELPRGGFTELDVRKLESYRGRMRE